MGSNIHLKVSGKVAGVLKHQALGGTAPIVPAQLARVWLFNTVLQFGLLDHPSGKALHVLMQVLVRLGTIQIVHCRPNSPTPKWNPKFAECHFDPAQRGAKHQIVEVTKMTDTEGPALHLA